MFLRLAQGRLAAEELMVTSSLVGDIAMAFLHFCIYFCVDRGVINGLERGQSCQEDSLAPCW